MQKNIINGLVSVNLSLSSLCGANCIYCPTARGSKMLTKNMSFDLVKKIVDEIASEKFKKNHNVRKFGVSENGDAFYNDELIPILKYIKSKLPEVKVEIFTNFQKFNPDLMVEILKNKLIDSFWCNIDGSNEENYHAVKRLDFNNAKTRLKEFSKIRKDLDSKVTLNVLVLTLNNYIKTIKKYLKVFPIKLKGKENLENIPDDFIEIKNLLKEVLLENDKILPSLVWGWAEREQFDQASINSKKYFCPQISRIETEAFIAPDGSWYGCCLDYNYEIIFDNVKEKSLDEIFNSEKRKKFIEHLSDKKFSEMSGPCKSVNCCQLMHKNPIINNILRIVFGNKSISKKLISTEYQKK